ncbi:MAG: hypothetical protein ACU0CB_11225 [Roseovarius sp.]
MVQTFHFPEGLTVVFPTIRGADDAAKVTTGFVSDTPPFFTLPYLLSGCHAASLLLHVVARLHVAWQDTPRSIAPRAG